MKQAYHERGGVLSFIIIGVALTVVLVGGILLAKQQARSTRGVDTATVSESKTSDQQTNGASESSGSDSSSQSPSGSTTDSSNSSNSSTGSSSSSESTGSVATTGPSGTDIPSTGPTGTLVGIVALASVTAGAYSYRQSARRLRASALK